MRIEDIINSSDKLAVPVVIADNELYWLSVGSFGACFNFGQNQKEKKSYKFIKNISCIPGGRFFQDNEEKYILSVWK